MGDAVGRFKLTEHSHDQLSDDASDKKMSPGDIQLQYAQSKDSRRDMKALLRKAKSETQGKRQVTCDE